ncbi:SirB2 family protein [Haliea sp. E1-2-M8]|uniref:SirB2 family protein n=1 Tax=Haliea sp. E1-2-M8 TaxID=3064706 RepID=UPI002725EA53|nr:SirB2 family protein [Haliea sp. E1-2-M8]MDO8860370.1 SirB2 family protein [Haliea sp. E1-2-M8]
MEGYALIKLTHLLAAYLTGLLFVLRLLLDLAGQPSWRQTPLRWLPHANDTVLLAMALSLLVFGGWQITVHSWLALKVVLLLGYIAAGMVAMKPRFRVPVRVLAAGLALAQLAGIYFLAMTRPVLW